MMNEFMSFENKKRGGNILFYTVGFFIFCLAAIPIYLESNRSVTIDTKNKVLPKLIIKSDVEGNADTLYRYHFDKMYY